MIVKTVFLNSDEGHNPVIFYDECAYCNITEFKLPIHKANNSNHGIEKLQIGFFNENHELIIGRDVIPPFVVYIMEKGQTIDKYENRESRYKSDGDDSKRKLSIMAEGGALTVSMKHAKSEADKLGLRK